jgi:hypothetical protein
MARDSSSRFQWNSDFGGHTLATFALDLAMLLRPQKFEAGQQIRVEVLETEESLENPVPRSAWIN